MIPFFVPSYAGKGPPEGSLFILRLWSTLDCGDYGDCNWVDYTYQDRQQPLHWLQDPKEKLVHGRSFHISRSLKPHETLTFFSGPDKERACETFVGEKEGYLSMMLHGGPDDDQGGHFCFRVNEADPMVNATVSDFMEYPYQAHPSLYSVLVFLDNTATPAGRASLYPRGPL